jgi:mono/diheme cytochrome c family protein
MKPVLVLLIVVSVALTGVYGIITVYDNNMSVGRMWQTPAIRPHEQPLPIMATGIVPFNGGEALDRTASDSALVSPITTATTAFDFKQAEKAYTAFCSQCHGKNHDGLGTVGQSFQPLPGDLRSKKVQAMADGTLFREISYGIPGGRQPALATTISMADRWQIIAYLKSLGTRP